MSDKSYVLPIGDHHNVFKLSPWDSLESVINYRGSPHYRMSWSNGKETRYFLVPCIEIPADQMEDFVKEYNHEHKSDKL